MESDQYRVLKKRFFQMNHLQDLVREMAKNCRNEKYENIRILCLDGELRLNQVIALLILPELRSVDSLTNQDVILLPDVHVQEIHSRMQKLFQSLNQQCDSGIHQINSEAFFYPFWPPSSTHYPFSPPAPSALPGTTCESGSGQHVFQSPPAVSSPQTPGQWRQDEGGLVTQESQHFSQITSNVEKIINEELVGHIPDSDMLFFHDAELSDERSRSLPCRVTSRKVLPAASKHASSPSRPRYFTRLGAQQQLAEHQVQEQYTQVQQHQDLQQRRDVQQHPDDHEHQNVQQLRQQHQDVQQQQLHEFQQLQDIQQHSSVIRNSKPTERQQVVHLERRSVLREESVISSGVKTAQQTRKDQVHQQVEVSYAIQHQHEQVEPDSLQLKQRIVDMPQNWQEHVETLHLQEHLMQPLRLQEQTEQPSQLLSEQMRQSSSDIQEQLARTAMQSSVQLEQNSSSLQITEGHVNIEQQQQEVENTFSHSKDYSWSAVEPQEGSSSSGVQPTAGSRNKTRGLKVKQKAGAEEDDESLPNERRPTCDQCNQTFTSKQSLNRHIKGKHNKETQTCPTCHKDIRKDNFFQHKQLHSTVKFGCRECGKTFPRKIHLKTHMKNHSGEREFKCTQEGCDKSFRLNSELNKHMKVHQPKQFRCECGKEFISNVKLQRHMKTHGEEKNYKCGKCGSSFNRTDNLKKHLKKFHKIVLSDLRETPLARHTDTTVWIVGADS